MTIDEKIAELKAAGVSDVVEMQRQMIVRPVTVTAGTTPRPVYTDERALRTLLVNAGIITGPQWASADPANREDLIDGILTNQIANAADITAGWPLLKLRARVDSLERKIRRQGGDPYGITSGDATSPTESRSYGSSWWATNYPGVNEPTLNQIRQKL